MSQSRGLLMYDSLARLPSPFIIHPDWKDETDSGCDMCRCVMMMNRAEALLFLQAGKKRSGIEAMAKGLFFCCR